MGMMKNERTMMPFWKRYVKYNALLFYFWLLVLFNFFRHNKSKGNNNKKDIRYSQIMYILSKVIEDLQS